MNKECGRIFVVSGPSGSGKTTLLKRLKAKKEFRSNLIKIITVTTRKNRDGEKDGDDYRFVGRKEFLRLLKRGEFIESEKIFGEYYGTPKKNLLKVIDSGKDALLCVDVKGALSIRRAFHRNTVLIFISVPTIKSLEGRLHLRSSETKESLSSRLKIAKEEMGYLNYYDYNIVNDVFSDALNKISAIIVAERQKVLKNQGDENR